MFREKSFTRETNKNKCRKKLGKKKAGEEEKSDTKEDENTLEGDTDHFLDQTPGEEETE